VAPSKAAKEPELLALEDHQPLTSTWSAIVLNFANTATLLLAAGLLSVVVYEYTSSHVRDPVLFIAMGVCGLTLISSLVGLVGGCREPKQSTAGNRWLHANHIMSMTCMVLMIALAVGALIHWDVTGQPIHTLHLGPHMSSVHFRCLIWGLSLGCALAMVMVTFGTLGRDWADEDGIFKRTLFACNVLNMFVGLALVGIGAAIYVYHEMFLSTAVWIIGSMVAGGVLFLVSLNGLAVSSVQNLNYYLFWMPSAALLVMFFSIANAVTAEPERISDRRTHVLLSGLVGLWSQIITVVAIVSASRWRFYLTSRDILPEYNR
jgi:hypothetical protein